MVRTKQHSSVMMAYGISASGKTHTIEVSSLSLTNGTRAVSARGMDQPCGVVVNQWQEKLLLLNILAAWSNVDMADGHQSRYGHTV